MPDALFDADAIRAYTFVRHVEIHETLGSTNDRATELIGDLQIALPALIVARKQTAGRGRGSNKWSSSEGSLTFSVLLDPAVVGIRPSNWPQLSLATAVAVCDALASELRSSEDNLVAANEIAELGLAIKWPNDVMLEGRKICGILIESPGGGVAAKNRLIVGVGINVNNRVAGQHADVGDGASLCEAAGRECDIAHVLTLFLNSFQARLSQLASNDTQLPQTWQALTWLKEKSVEVQLADGRRTIGVCAGTDIDGALLVDGESGRERFRSGSLRAR